MITGKECRGCLGKRGKSRKGIEQKKKNPSWSAESRVGSCRCPLLLGCWERKRREGSALNPLCPLHPPETQPRVPIPSHTRIPEAHPFISPFSAPSLSMSTPEKIISSGSVSAAPAGGQQQLSVEPPRPHPAPRGLGSTAQGALIIFWGRFMQFLSSQGTRSRGDGCQPRARPLFSLAASP